MAYTDQHSFEDEPLGEAGKQPDSSNGIAFQFEGVDEALAKAERRRERRRRRHERTGKIAACCICVCLIIAISITVALVKKAERVVHDTFVLVTESPTPYPTGKPTLFITPAPSAAPKPTFSVVTPLPTTTTKPPTPVPTVSPTVTPDPTNFMVDEYTFEPEEDTYLFIDGPNKVRKYGSEDAILVQHGTRLSTKPGQDPEIPTAYSFIKFSLKHAHDFPDRSRWHESFDLKLKLTHIAKNNYDENGVAIEDRTPMNLEIYRIPNNYDLVLESWTGVAFDSAPKYYKDGVLVQEVSIEPADKNVEIDVKSALFLSEDQMSSGLYGDEQILFMFVVKDGTPEIGDQFKSRESSQPPELCFSNMLA